MRFSSSSLAITTLALIFMFVFGAARTSSAADPESNMTNQYYEIRTYVIGDKDGEDTVDKYLEQALLPALERMKLGPIGVFSPADNDTNDLNAIFVVIPFNNADEVARQKLQLQQDQEYLSAAKDYLSRGPKDPPYQRISSELLAAMACMPELKVPEGTLENKDRVYELRLYESANERLGDLKVDMFNNGEVPIFLDSGITPIFIGQALIGPQTPNLTYLTVYPDDESRLKAWTAFRQHPDWQVLKGVEKYKGTVSKIDKYILKPKSYSRM